MPSPTTRKVDVDAGSIRALLAAVFGTSVPVSFERTAEGVSTQVYRLRRGRETFYLRVAEEAGDNLETDAELHRRLLDRGVRVPGIVFVDPFDAAIGRSVMVTTEIAGSSLAETTSPADAVAVIAEAGADLAVLNEVTVDGFGWIRRHGPGWPLRAEHPGYPAFLTSDLPEPWPGPLAALFPAAALGAIETMLEHSRADPPGQAHLAHGDFDATPVFGVGARYSGLIDFGEIRGTEPLFDLAHFHLHDTEIVPVALLPALIRGYERVRALPPDHHEAIRRGAVLLGLRQLCRWLGPPRHHPPQHPAIADRTRRITELLARR